jgi:hypothetical protein
MLSVFVDSAFDTKLVLLPSFVDVNVVLLEASHLRRVGDSLTERGMGIVGAFMVIYKFESSLVTILGDDQKPIPHLHRETRFYYYGSSLGFSQVDDDETRTTPRARTVHTGRWVYVGLNLRVLCHMSLFECLYDELSKHVVANVDGTQHTAHGSRGTPTLPSHSVEGSC